MASIHFYYSPTTGTGNAQITVSAATTNATSSDKSATITFDNGVSTATVNVLQRFKPYVDQGWLRIPGTGGTATLTAYSEYDVVFRSIPAWLSVWQDGTRVNAGDRISLDPYNYGVFTLSAGTNDGGERNSGQAGMNMAHYIGDTMITTNAPIIECIQYANTGIQVDTNEVVFDWNQTTGGTFNITSNVSWTSTIEDD